MMQVFFRAFRRLGLALHFSKGFNPTPKVSFSPALSLGVESRAEFLRIILAEPIEDTNGFLASLNEHLPEGLRVTAVDAGQFPMPDVMAVRYRVFLPTRLSDAKVREFLTSECLPIAVIRKNKTKSIDARPLVTDLKLDGDSVLEVELRSAVSLPGMKVQELVGWLCGLPEGQSRSMRIEKLGWRPL